MHVSIWMVLQDVTVFYLFIYSITVHVHDLNFTSVENTFYVSLNRFIYYILNKLISLFAFSRNSDLSQEM